MIVIPTHNAVFFDVDDTLVIWNPTTKQLALDGVEMDCPGALVSVDGKLIQSKPWKALIVPHKIHVEQLIKHKMRGHVVVVWSAGGWDWAEAAVKALQLEQYVDLVISKPTWAYDDLPAEKILPHISYMKDE